MFRGINGISIDPKGRIVIPVRYREAIALTSENNLVVTIDTEDRCLLLYPAVEWQEIEKQLALLPSFLPATRRIQRLLIGHATDTEMDDHGRILLAPMLREYAGLQKNAIIIGQGKKFELWDETNWQESRERWIHAESNAANELPNELKSISL